VRAAALLSCLALVSCLALAGCSAPGSGMLTLSWTFADLRRCTDAGAATVEVQVDGGKVASFACTAGSPPAAVMVEVARAGTLTARALSPQLSELYRGDAALDAALLPITVTMFATGAR
jgi:hypothetical protein